LRSGFAMTTTATTFTCPGCHAQTRLSRVPAAGTPFKCDCGRTGDRAEGLEVEARRPDAILFAAAGAAGFVACALFLLAAWDNLARGWSAGAFATLAALAAGGGTAAGIVAWTGRVRTSPLFYAETSAFRRREVPLDALRAKDVERVPAGLILRGDRVPGSTLRRGIALVRGTPAYRQVRAAAARTGAAPVRISDEKVLEETERLDEVLAASRIYFAAIAGGAALFVVGFTVAAIMEGSLGSVRSATLATLVLLAGGLSLLLLRDVGAARVARTALGEGAPTHTS
jgi:hypothetical protein